MATIQFTDEIRPVKSHDSHPVRRNSGSGANAPGVYSIRNVSKTSGLGPKEDVENAQFEETKLHQEGDIKKRQVRVYMCVTCVHDFAQKVVGIQRMDFILVVYVLTRCEVGVLMSTGWRINQPA